ncbi:enoyl-CoA hydratase [Sphingobium lactosutens]|uniref:enoyl-CoA hydratase/isomerase family protein n=1 Tax=Sphingobium lactosutens TaxID=522773 RepID=UPI0015BA308E|nr:enoyl-CoA hydratase-related protein [Sphingobium lactosutens]NWK95971.1 enoyl-CoA hydratase [Sphingobium lactosutens]
MSGNVLCSIEGDIAWITLNQPEAANAISLAMARSLRDAAMRCESDPAVRCVVMTGNGKLFCAGGDLMAMGGAGDKLPALLAELIATLNTAVTRLARMPKPLLTLVNGPAAGAGLSLAILGDVVLSARSAHYTAAYGPVGLTCDGGLSWLLPRLVGLRKAQEIILTNRRIKADEAEAVGLVTRTVDDDVLKTEGRAMARTLAATPAIAFGATRSLLRDSFEAGFETQLDRELRTMVLAGAGEAQDRLAALLAIRTSKSSGA